MHSLLLLDLRPFSEQRSSVSFAAAMRLDGRGAGQTSQSRYIVYLISMELGYLGPLTCLFQWLVSSDLSSDCSLPSPLSLSRHVPFHLREHEFYMRRAASLRSQTRSASSPSAAAGYLVDDLGIVREEGGAGGSGEDELRRVQRENERVSTRNFSVTLFESMLM